MSWIVYYYYVLRLVLLKKRLLGKNIFIKNIFTPKNMFFLGDWRNGGLWKLVTLEVAADQKLGKYFFPAGKNCGQGCPICGVLVAA